MNRIEKISSRVPRIALTAFRASPLLAECEAKPLFIEIFDLVKTGMSDDEIVQAVIQNHAAKPNGSSLH